MMKLGIIGIGVVGSDEHKAALELANVMANKFEMAVPAIFGQIIKFYDAVRAVTHTERGMINLNITVSEQLAEARELINNSKQENK